MRQIECFFFVDQPDDPAAKVRAVCTGCHGAPGVPNGWYYHGLSGDWDWQCAACGNPISYQPLPGEFVRTGGPSSETSACSTGG